MLHKKAKTFIFPSSPDSDKENSRVSTPKKSFSPLHPPQPLPQALNISIPSTLSKLQSHSYVPDCLQNHIISPLHRLKLVEWMIEVTKVLSTKQSFFSAVKILDKYLYEASEPIPSQCLQIAGLSCIFIASKLYDLHPIRLQTLVSRAACQRYSKAQIIHYERHVLKTLGFYANLVTAFDFISLMCTKLQMEIPMIYTCELVCYYCMMSYEILRYSEEEIAVGCVGFTLMRFRRVQALEKLLEDYARSRAEEVREEIQKCIKYFGGKNEIGRRLATVLQAEIVNDGEKDRGIFKFHDKMLEKAQQKMIRNK